MVIKKWINDKREVFLSYRYSDGERDQTFRFENEAVFMNFCNHIERLLKDGMLQECDSLHMDI